jgi:hypothetical protein
MRLLPASLFGRMMLILFSGLVLAQSRRGLLALVVVANLIYAPPAAPAGRIGVNTRVVRESDDVLAEVARNQRWIDQAAAAVAATGQDHSTPASRVAKAGAKKHGGVVVVLPEDVAGTWGPGTTAQVRAAMRPGDVWLVGASVPEARHWDGRYLNAVVGLGQRGNALLFVSPVARTRRDVEAMGWREVNTSAHWREPVQTIDWGACLGFHLL